MQRCTYTHTHMTSAAASDRATPPSPAQPLPVALLHLLRVVRQTKSFAMSRHSSLASPWPWACSSSSSSSLCLFIFYSCSLARTCTGSGQRTGQGMGLGLALAGVLLRPDEQRVLLFFGTFTPKHTHTLATHTHTRTHT